MNTTRTAADIDYPSSDGKPMAENTKQFDWIVTIKGNLDVVFKDRPDVFVAGDHLIYPVEGHPEIRQAPDIYVAFGRPKGHRGSYRVFEEDSIFPQVVFEILSPGNRGSEMARKLKFYERYGVVEYYIYDPDTYELSGWRRIDGALEEIPEMNGYLSPLLGIRFDLNEPELRIFTPEGEPFLTFVELGRKAREDEIERRISDAARAKAEAERDRSLIETERLRTLLQQAGIDPDAART